MHKANADVAVASFRELLPRNHVEGATYAAPSTSYEETVNVVRICALGQYPRLVRRRWCHRVLDNPERREVLLRKIRRVEKEKSVLSASANLR